MLGVSKMDLQTRGNIKSIVPFKKVVRQIYCFQIFKFLSLDHPLAVDFDFVFIFEVPTTKVRNGMWAIEK